MTAEKLSVTIDKGQNPGHFWIIKKSPQMQLPVKEDMSGKTWMKGNPNLNQLGEAEYEGMSKPKRQLSLEYSFIDPVFHLLKYSYHCH